MEILCRNKKEKLFYLFNRINLLSKVQYINILNNNDVTKTFNFDTDYYYTLRFINKQKAIVANTNLNVFMEVIHYPSYLAGNDFRFLNKTKLNQFVIDYKQMTNNTNANGDMDIRLTKLINH